MVKVLLAFGFGLLFVIGIAILSVYRAAWRLTAAKGPPLDKCHAGESAVAILQTGDGRRQVTPHVQE